jgi:molybdenum cofactor biosynthesis enzyme MoaA
MFSLSSVKSDSSYDRPPVCSKCNRLRLLCNGVLKPCLHSDLENKVDMNDIESSIKQAVLSKPENGGICSNNIMMGIGG